MISYHSSPVPCIRQRGAAGRKERENEREKF